MKRKLALLPLMVFALSACSLTTPNNENNQTNSNPNSGETQPSSPNDAAIKILNNTTFFPEVGDEVDLSKYISFDPGFGHTLSEYTFTSKDNTVISIDGYHAVCLKRGFTAIGVTGPGINRKTEINFYVGSIAGTYKPDSSRLKNLISFTIGEADAERICAFHLSIKEGTYKNNSLIPYEGNAEMFKNGTPFLTLHFEGDGPANFSSISSYLAVLGLDASNEITDSTYGLMSYDVGLNVVSIKVIFMGEVIEFLSE